MAVPGEDLQAIRRFCDDRVPKKARDQVRVVCAARGNRVTISEERPLFASVSDEWVSKPIAQLRYQPGSSAWTIYWHHRGRWEAPPAALPGQLDAMLLELAVDPMSLFWG